MKRTLTYISGVLLLITALCISCQKEQNSLEEKGAPANEVVIRATISDAATKVSFTEEDNKLKTAWETDDHIVGWDAEGNAIELEIASIEDNTAIFKKVEGSAAVPSSGKVYMIYAPDKHYTHVSGKSLTYDLGSQNINSVPALMTATASVSNNVLALDFINRLAIVAVKNPTFPVTAATPITGLQLSGGNIWTMASFSLDSDGELQMSSSVPGAITKDCSFTTGTDGTTSATVYFAVLPNTTEANVTVSTTAPTGYQISFPSKSFTAGQCYMLNQKNINKQTFTVTVADGITNGTITTNPSGSVEWGTEVTVTATPATGYELDAITVKDADGADVPVTNGKFTMPAKNVTVTATFKKSHDYVMIGGKKWATMNIGATNPQDYGKYFQWGEIAGHECNGTYSFDWASAPFNNKQSTYQDSYFTTNKGTWITDNVLKPNYDAAYQTCGSPWRMPTTEDFVNLFKECYAEWGTYKGVNGLIVYKANNDNDKGLAYFNSKMNQYSGSGNTWNTTTKTRPSYSTEIDTFVFFPAAGFGAGTSLEDEGSLGYYWSSTLHSSLLDRAYYLRFNSGRVDPQNGSTRCNGFSVRPVSD